MYKVETIAAGRIATHKHRVQFSVKSDLIVWLGKGGGGDADALIKRTKSVEVARRRSAEVS